MEAMTVPDVHAPPRPSPAGAGTPPPAVVLRAAERATGGLPVPEAVEITQEGRMWFRPGARPRAFTATQVLWARRPDFTWRARFPMLGPLGIRVLDETRGGRGRLEVRAAGIPLQRRAGPEIDLGEMLRYLAELAWVPFAMTANPSLTWTAGPDEACAIVTAPAGDATARLVTRFSPLGDVLHVSCDARPRDAGAAPAPWAGDFGDHRAMGGVRIPTRGSVRWELGTGPFTYWEGTVTGLRLLPQYGRTENGG